MSISWLIYFAELCNPLCFISGIIGVIFLVFLIAAICMQFDDDVTRDNKNSAKKSIPYIAFFSFLFLLIMLLIPRTKTAYLMIGSEYLKSGIESLYKSDLPDKVRMVLEKKLDEIVKGDSK